MGGPAHGGFAELGYVGCELGRGTPQAAPMHNTGRHGGLTIREDRAWRWYASHGCTEIAEAIIREAQAGNRDCSWVVQYEVGPPNLPDPPAAPWDADLSDHEYYLHHGHRRAP